MTLDEILINKIDALGEKVEVLDEKLDSVDSRLAVYNEQLKVHIKRTTNIEQELLPVVKHVEQIKGAWTFAKYSAAVVAFLVTSGVGSWFFFR